jgi:MFS-type transporter involved in bile tolerance (Atg22 family)
MGCILLRIRWAAYLPHSVAFLLNFLKSSSFFGPLVVGIIADVTGNIRYAFFFLFGMILAAVLPLLVVDVEQGHRDAEKYVVA